jgi:hypothetical protein
MFRSAPVFKRLREVMSNQILRTADVFTIAIPTVSYVAREQVEKDIKRELERADRIVCLTGPSKSGKTVLVKKIIPDCPVIHGQVGVSAPDIWKQLCSILSIPLHFREGLETTVEGRAGPIGGWIYCR